MTKLNDMIVPDELIIGIKDELCYITYKEKKGINSETSWRNWSKNSDNPPIVPNKFSKGFKLAGVNGRWSSQANNQSNLLIYHPLAKKNMEISLDNFLQIASQCSIVEGEFDCELIISKRRTILTRKDYEEEIKVKFDGCASKSEWKAKLKEKAVKYKDLEVGKLYKNRSNNRDIVFLGECTHYGEKMYAYYEEWGAELGKESYPRQMKTLTCYSKDMIRLNVEVPAVLSAELKDKGKTVKFYKNWRVGCKKSKTALSAHDMELNILEGLMDEEISIITSVYEAAGFVGINWSRK